jgi:hypothetical protein
VEWWIDHNFYDRLDRVFVGGRQDSVQRWKVTDVEDVGG